MAARDSRARNTAILIDTNAIIESVRVECWKALTGGRRVETVEECRDETQRGSPHRPGYVTVGPAELSGLAAVHLVSAVERAAFALRYPDALNMDPGERDLMAHAVSRAARGDSAWVVCSPDKATVRAAVALQLGDDITSLEDLAATVGARPSSPLKEQFTRRWLSDFRTRCLLEAAS